VPINHVIEVQFPQFASLVDELGGLRIEFPVPARDRYTGLAEPTGCATLTGAQALSFVRSRHLEWFDGAWHEDPRADLSRMERQQLALRQLAAAAQSRVGTDPRPLLRALFANITVDSGFTADDALRYFAALRGDAPTVTMTLPTHLMLRGDQQGLAPTADAQPVLDALAGHGSIAAPHDAPSGPSGHNIDATSC
jgi:anionic cell wall polymer biosynthesis LytR-Cps2A-Psr (LCP) family protein